MFTVAPDSSASSKTGSSASSQHRTYQPVRSAQYLQPFRSRKVREEDVFNWAVVPKSKKQIIARRLPWVAGAIGVLMVCAGAYWGYTDVPTYTYTNVVWYTDFSDNKLDLVNDFSRDVSFSGFGTNSLEWNTDSDNNTFVKDNQLWIKPTLTDLAYNVEGVSVNMTELGQCSVPYVKQDCFAQRNSTSGAFINAVQSGRLNTKGKHSLRYGRIEVNAKTPLGDWMWPAIWMLPEDDVYGIWPASGEIDLVESRGNVVGYPGGGYDTIQASVHMAPVGESTYATGGEIKGKVSNPSVPIPLSFLPGEFHTYGMDWTPQFLRIWVDDPIYALLQWDFLLDPIDNFGLPATNPSTGAAMISPWTISNHKSAPFDESFYLIMNVAVGGQSGYFDTKDAPWSRDADYWTAQKQVWEAREELSKTWHTDHNAMVIDWIRMTELDNVDHWENLKSALYT